MALLLPIGSPTPGNGRLASRRHAAACAHLAAADPVMRRLISLIGPCRLSPRRNTFLTLCDSIIAQQLSPMAAARIFDRFTALYPARRPTPEQVASTRLGTLRRAGLSGQKAAYIKDLAAGFLDGRLSPRELMRQSNEEIINRLVSIRGIGRWTAEMFLIFSLNRPDVLPLDDLGIRKAVQRWYGLRRLPSVRTLKAIGAAWHPYESIAAWYLWQSLHLHRCSPPPAWLRPRKASPA